MQLVPSKSGRRARRYFLGIASIVGVVAVIAAVAIYWRTPATRQAAKAPQPVPVTVTPVMQRDVPIFLDGLGTVTAQNTIAIRSQIDGKLTSVNFVEGQQVHKGDTLATVDPRPLQATLDQATAKKAQDEAQLVAAQKDLTRFTSLAARDFETQQNVDQQRAKVDQLKATVDADQAAIEAAQVQLSYATIVAPIDGRIGFRQVDAGNIIHANDTNPLTVLTQIRPVNVQFTLPQKDLSRVREAMLRGDVPVIAFDQDSGRQLAQGKLLLINNQIDQTTSTIQLKAQFANEDDRLWPGEFIRVRIQVDTSKDALTIPPVAVQRGPNGFFAWVAKPDGTADQREIQARSVDNDTTIVEKGLEAGEQVVVNGQHRLQPGTHIEPKTESAKNSADKDS